MESSFIRARRNAFTTGYRTRADAYTDVHDYIEWLYNQVRRHSTLGNISPAMYELTHAV